MWLQKENHVKVVSAMALRIVQTEGKVNFRVGMIAYRADTNTENYTQSW